MPNDPRLILFQYICLCQLLTRLSSANKLSQNLSFLNQHRFILTSHVHHGSCREFCRHCLHVWAQTDREIPSVILLVSVVNEKNVLEGVLPQNFHVWIRIDRCHLYHIGSHYVTMVTIVLPFGSFSSPSLGPANHTLSRNLIKL